MRRFVTHVACFCALSIAVGGALLLGPSGCDGCGSVTESAYFNGFDYYTWAWERSGGTLTIQGVVLTSSADFRAYLAAPGAPCPPPTDVIPYAKEVLRPPKTNRANYKNIRAATEQEKRA